MPVGAHIAGTWVSQTLFWVETRVCQTWVP